MKPIRARIIRRQPDVKPKGNTLTDSHSNKCAIGMQSMDPESA